MSSTEKRETEKCRVLLTELLNAMAVCARYSCHKMRLYGERIAREFDSLDIFEWYECNLSGLMCQRTPDGCGSVAYCHMIHI